MQKKSILFVVADPVDIILAQMAFRDSRVENELSIVSTGEQAMRFVRRESPYQQEQLPDLIIVDLEASSRCCWAFVEALKSSSEFRRIPVIVFSPHMSEHDAARLYDMNVNCCIRKPLDLEQFAETIENIERFWLHTANLQYRASRLLNQDRVIY